LDLKVEIIAKRTADKIGYILTRYVDMKQIEIAYLTLEK
jgi:hypothetical protein